MTAWGEPLGPKGLGCADLVADVDRVAGAEKCVLLHADRPLVDRSGGVDTDDGPGCAPVCGRTRQKPRSTSAGHTNASRHEGLSKRQRRVTAPGPFAAAGRSHGQLGKQNRSLGQILSTNCEAIVARTATQSHTPSETPDLPRRSLSPACGQRAPSESAPPSGCRTSATIGCVASAAAHSTDTPQCPVPKQCS